MEHYRASIEGFLAIKSNHEGNLYLVESLTVGEMQKINMEFLN